MVVGVGVGAGEGVGAIVGLGEDVDAGGASLSPQAIKKVNAMTPDANSSERHQCLLATTHLA